MPVPILANTKVSCNASKPGFSILESAHLSLPLEVAVEWEQQVRGALLLSVSTDAASSAQLSGRAPRNRALAATRLPIIVAGYLLDHRPVVTFDTNLLGTTYDSNWVSTNQRNWHMMQEDGRISTYDTELGKLTEGQISHAGWFLLPGTRLFFSFGCGEAAP